MSFAYFDCPSGISGDMMLGALIDIGVPIELLNESIQSVLNPVQVSSSIVFRKEFRAIQAEVKVPHEHIHRTLPDILELIEKSSLSAKNQESAGKIFQLLAEAEAKVHGTSADKVHFHEIGAADSIADIIGVVVGLDYLEISQFGASSVPTGTGTVRIAHGESSVPAPATVELLKGIPISASSVPFELTTPTGAVFLKYYVKNFGVFPAMTVQKIGVGAGSRDLEQQANIMRIILGTLPVKEISMVHDHQFEDLLGAAPQHKPPVAEMVWIVETNIDDMSGELAGHCVEKLWTLSPLDVWITPIQMKKHRPGITISVMCQEEQLPAVELFLFSETSTLGLRRYPVKRTVLHRETHRVKTPWGEMEAKRAILPNGMEKIMPEFESAKRLAAAKGIPVWKIMEN